MYIYVTLYMNKINSSQSILCYQSLTSIPDNFFSMFIYFPLTTTTTNDDRFDFLIMSATSGSTSSTSTTTTESSTTKHHYTLHPSDNPGALARLLYVMYIYVTLYMNKINSSRSILNISYTNGLKLVFIWFGSF